MIGSRDLHALRLSAIGVAAALSAVLQFPAIGVAVTLTLLPVGDPGNAVDPRPLGNRGAVSYTYYLDKYDVTNSQYAEFLNAKAVISDPFELYDAQMGSFDNGGIVRSANAPYNYTVKPGMDNKPVVYVSWYDALRFTNWLTNGQGIGDTESGSYLIAGGGPNSGVAVVPSAAQRAAWSTSSRHYLLPSADEWYKAAYYRGGGTNAGYNDYPLKGNVTPVPGPPGTPFGANLIDRSGRTALPGPVFLTDVGAYSRTSPYGQSDMAGNVMQYSDSPGRGGNPQLADEWGAAFNGGVDGTLYYGGGASTATFGFDDIGFRVMMVPEPGTLTLAALATLGLLGGLAAQRKAGRQCPP